MKLVSPNALFASLLGGAFVVMQIVTFDGIQDFFWIVFLGYLTIKALIAAFSQAAYDEDMNNANLKALILMV